MLCFKDTEGNIVAAALMCVTHFPLLYVLLMSSCVISLQRTGHLTELVASTSWET